MPVPVVFYKPFWTASDLLPGARCIPNARTPPGRGVGQSSAAQPAFQDRAESGPKSIVAERALEKSNGFASGPRLRVPPQYGEVQIRARTRSAPMPPLGLLRPAPGGRVFPRVTVPAPDFPGMVHLLPFSANVPSESAPGRN